MKHAATQELYAYWRSLCRGRSAPERNDIDPAAIRGVLADTFMIEVDDVRPAARAYPIRLSGTRINALFNRELKGASMPALWAAKHRTDMLELIDVVLDNATPAVAGCMGSPAGYPPLHLELLLLPLRHKGRTHARLLAGLSPREVPSWLGLLPIDPLSLTSHRMIDTASSGPDNIGLTLDTLDRRPSSARRPLRRGHFVIYDGGRTGRGHDDRVDAIGC